ncbi:MAG: alkaline phosphatase family protein [Micrococcales bacterium]|nr:MAG: alkaline phosphatase family protein [Micrococcales bacterium]PIE27905.1 MAG: alkaline phosphatase family protein [Micrococcales bacterium]
MSGNLSEVLPSAAASVGAVGFTDTLALPAADRVVVFLVDGLGRQLLERRAAYAPFLCSLSQPPARLQCSFPSTTATSIATLGTGQLPGAHGMFGYTVLDPDRDTVFNELSWQGGPDPRQWQDRTTVFETTAQAGIPCFQIGDAHFAGSGLTQAALRGATFVGARTLDDRIDAAARILRSAPRALVYLYWGDVDKVGHGLGWQSEQWSHELAAVDLAARQLAARVPADTSIVITADHGMVDVPPEARFDLGQPTGLGAQLALGIRHLTGDPRAPMLFCQEGQADAVLRRWRTELGPGFDIKTRDEAIRAGWFGPVRPQLRSRVGDIVVTATGPGMIWDSRNPTTSAGRLIGMHGGLTSQEMDIPLLVLPPRRPR